MLKNNRKTDKLYWWAAGTVVVLVLILVVVFGGGGGSARIVITSLEGEATIFVDSIEARRVRGAQENLTLRGLTPGIHSILIARDGFWPWLKEVRLNESEVVTVNPFFVLQSPSGLIVPEEDEEYESLLARFQNISLPTFEDKKVSSNGNVALWVDGSSLFVEWTGLEEERPEYYCNEFGCHNVIVPLGVGANIRNVDFYKGREDVFIVSFGTGVFAIEADTTANQNFQPIFEGESPQFISEDENSVYVLSNDLLLQVAI